MNVTSEGVGFATLAIHAGAQAVSGSDDPAPSPSPIELGGLGRIDLPRSSPANAVLEERIAALEGGTAALALASGRAARMLVLQTLLQPGDEFVAARRVHATSLDLFTHVAPTLGWHVRWADTDKTESFVDALSDRTKAIVIESFPAAGGLTDIEAIAGIARRARVPLVVDNTLATPFLVRPLDHGADIVLHATTALLAGHADAAGGLIVDGGSFSFVGDERFPNLSRPRADGLVIADAFGNFAFATAARSLGLRDAEDALGADDARRAAHGMATLALRMKRHSDNAQAVARYLARHPKVSWVRYAGLDDDLAYAMAERYCPKGAGAIVTFGLRTQAAVPAVLDRLRLVARHAAIGDPRSFAGRAVEPPGAAQDAIRLSLGLEDASDIITDLDLALEG